MSVRVIQLDLDTEVFDLRCGRLGFGESPPSCEALDAALAEARERDIQHLVARVPSHWLSVCRHLESRGLRFAVCSLSLIKQQPGRAGEALRASAREAAQIPGGFPKPPNTETGRSIHSGRGRLAYPPAPGSAGGRLLRSPPAEPGAEGTQCVAGVQSAGHVSLYEGEDDARLVAITDEAFHAGTRFHMEPAFHPGNAADLHRRWIRNLIADDAVRIWVHRADGTITGYITLAAGDRPGAGHIGLIGVDAAFRRRGIGRILLAALENAARPAIETITVVTESINLAALRLYTRSGFTIQQSWTVFHAMIPPSREVTDAGKECRTADSPA